MGAAHHNWLLPGTPLPAAAGPACQRIRKIRPTGGL
jgi:hypothetical protein